MRALSVAVSVTAYTLASGMLLKVSAPLAEILNLAASVPLRLQETVSLAEKLPTAVDPAAMETALVESPALPDRPVIVGAVLSTLAVLDVSVITAGSLTFPRVESESYLPLSRTETVKVLVSASH